MKRRIFALVITLMMLVGLVGCSTQGEDQTEQQKQEPEEGESTELIVYGWSGNWDLWFADWAKEFEEEYGINIKYISGQGTAMRERIVAEDAAQSDIFISTPGDAFLLGNQAIWQIFHMKTFQVRRMWTRDLNIRRFVYGDMMFIRLPIILILCPMTKHPNPGKSYLKKNGQVR